MPPFTCKDMPLVLGVVVPAAALALCVRYVAAVPVLVAYVLLFVLSEWARRLGRAGGCVPKRQGRPVVLGGGWSWVLRRRWCPPNTISCASGQSARADGDWWHAGSTIGEVQRALAAEGRTLTGHPSVASATLGGWIASRSHGSGGSLWTPTMGRVVVEDGTSGVRREVPSKNDVADGDVVREVEMFSVPNVVCERRVAYLEGEADARRHLFAPTHLRAVFVDRYSCLAVTWNPCVAEAKEAAWPEFPPLWLMIPLPARARRRLSVERWNRRMRLRSASLLGPDPPFFVATAAIAAHTNFEIFVTGELSTPHLVWRLCEAFRAMFAEGHLQGRMELRFGRQTQFVDLDVVGRGGNAQVAVGVLRRVYAGARVAMALHPGKAQVVDL